MNHNNDDGQVCGHGPKGTVVILSVTLGADTYVPCPQPRGFPLFFYAKHIWKMYMVASELVEPSPVLGTGELLFSLTRYQLCEVAEKPLLD